MSNDSMTVKLDKDLKSLLGTKITTCLSFKCDFNIRGECQLKYIVMKEDGTCYYFKINDKKHL